MEEPCAICANGPQGGLELKGRRICPECREKILQIQVGEDQYQDLIASLKKLWEEWGAG